MCTKYNIPFHFVNNVSIYVIPFPFKSVAKALHFKRKKSKIKWRTIAKKWRWKKSTSEIRHLWSPFSHTRYPNLSWHQICKCFAKRNVIFPEISPVVGTFDAFSMFTSEAIFIQNPGVHQHCTTFLRRKYTERLIAFHKLLSINCLVYFTKSYQNIA